MTLELEYYDFTYTMNKFLVTSINIYGYKCNSSTLNLTVAANTESGPAILIFIQLFYFQNHVCHCLEKGILIHKIKTFLFEEF